jgi:MFS family permease
MFLMSAIAGRIEDTVGAVRAAGASMLAFGIAFVAGSRLIESIEELWLLYAIAAVGGIATTPVGLLRPVAANFSARRGLAMGIVLCGVGLGAARVPQCATIVVAKGELARRPRRLRHGRSPSRRCFGLCFANARIAPPWTHRGQRQSAWMPQA